jgi:hypothetical protein
MAMKIGMGDRHFMTFVFISHQRPDLASAAEKNF